MKIFITGATGVLGKRVLKLLEKNQAEVRALARSEANEKIISAFGATPVPGDLFNEADMIRASKGCDTILHLATAIPTNDKTTAEDWKINDRIRTQGTRVLIRAAQVNQIERFFQQSVALLYGNRNGKTVTAATPISTIQLSMLQSAKEMEEIIEQSDIDYLIIRFGSFYSADSTQTRKLLEGVKKRKIPIVGKGDYFWNMIHADDAASALLYLLVNREDLHRQIINVSDFNPISFKDQLHSMASAMSCTAPKSIPKWLGRLFLGKDVYGVLTSSYQLVKENSMQDWFPAHPNFEIGIQSVVKEINMQNENRKM